MAIVLLFGAKVRRSGLFCSPPSDPIPVTVALALNVDVYMAAGRAGYEEQDTSQANWLISSRFQMEN